MEEWGFDLEEKYYFASPVAGRVARDGGGALRFYSGIPTEVKVTFDDSWPAAPDGLAPFGHVRFRDPNTPDKKPGDQRGPVVLEVPIQLE
jgi:hypothetical protein